MRQEGAIILRADHLDVHLLGGLIERRGMGIAEVAGKTVDIDGGTAEGVAAVASPAAAVGESDEQHNHVKNPSRYTTDAPGDDDDAALLGNAGIRQSTAAFVVAVAASAAAAANALLRQPWPPLPLYVPPYCAVTSPLATSSGLYENRARHPIDSTLTAQTSTPRYQHQALGYIFMFFAGGNPSLQPLVNTYHDSMIGP